MFICGFYGWKLREEARWLQVRILEFNLQGLRRRIDLGYFGVEAVWFGFSSGSPAHCLYRACQVFYVAVSFVGKADVLVDSFCQVHIAGCPRPYGSTESEIQEHSAVINSKSSASTTLQQTLNINNIL